MTVRAKFKVRSIVEYEGGNKEAKLEAVTSGSKENQEFFKWTPSASISLSMLNAPRKGGSRDYKPNPPRLDSALAREIAEHNEAVDRRKAEKMARKMAR